MTQEERIKLINKQVEVFNSIISGMKVCSNLVREWDGKIYDKRFGDALSALLNGPVYGYATTDYQDFYVCFTVQDDYIQLGTAPGSVVYVRTRAQAFNFDMGKAFDITPGGKRRINAIKICALIDARIECVERSIKEADYFAKNLEQFRAEARAVKKAVEDFRSKWSYAQQSYGGVNFILRNDAEEKDWDI